MENAQQPVRNKNGKTQKLPKSRISFWVTPIVFLIFFIGLFTLFAIPMGLSNMLSTVMNTAFALLTDTCLYIMAIAVIMGAVSALLTEFGVVVGKIYLETKGRPRYLAEMILDDWKGAQ